MRSGRVADATEASEAYDFLKEAEAEFQKLEAPEAYVLTNMEAAHFQLLLGDVAGTKAAMDACAKKLDEFDSVEPIVHASFYRVSGNYHKSKAEYTDYYRNFLLYLACINVDAELSRAEQVQSAHDLGISALLGDTIYNFGELLLHPILASLRDSEYAWIADLLFAFNAGDIGRFESLIPMLAREPILESNVAFLRQKICLMALIESVFRRSNDNRTLSFESLATETRIPVDEVEHLVMKALWCVSLLRPGLTPVSNLFAARSMRPRRSCTSLGCSRASSTRSRRRRYSSVSRRGATACSRCRPLCSRSRPSSLRARTRDVVCEYRTLQTCTLRRRCDGRLYPCGTARSTDEFYGTRMD